MYQDLHLAELREEARQRLTAKPQHRWIVNGEEISI